MPAEDEPPRRNLLRNKEGGKFVPPLPPKLYKVHLFAVVRIGINNVEAVSHRKAIEKAIDDTNLYSLFDTSGRDIEFAEEFSHFLVDVVGDENFNQTLWFYSEQEPLISMAAALAAWAKDRNLADDPVLKAIVDDAREAVAIAV